MVEAILSLDSGRLALLGIVLSALVASLGYYGKLRYERKKTRRLVLFHLLRIRDATLWADRAAQSLPSDLVTSVESALRRHELQLDDETRLSLIRASTRSLTDFLSEHARAAVAKLLPGLSISLLDLARDDPLLAARIAEGLPEASVPDPIAPGSVEDRPPFAVDLLDSLTTSARANSLERITSTLRLTALECSLRTRFDIELKLWFQSRWKPTPVFVSSTYAAVDGLVSSIVREETSRRTSPAASGAFDSET